MRYGALLGYIGSIAFLGALADGYLLDIIGMALLFGLFAASVDFSWGLCGVLTLGAAFYFGIGAYFMAYGLREGWSFTGCLAAGLFVALSIAALLGIVAFRVGASMIQFALISLVLSLTAEQLAVALYDLAGGSNGISGVPRPTLQALGASFDLSSGARYFYLSSAIVLLAFCFCRWLANGHFGRMARCVRHSEERAAGFGYDPAQVKLLATLCTAGVSALAGALFVPFNGIAHPGLFGVRPNMLVLVWVAIGGQGTLFGPFMAATVLTVLQFELGSQLQDLYLLVVGLVFVATVRWLGGRGLFTPVLGWLVRFRKVRLP